MSWDADLVGVPENVYFYRTSWNYTHNTSRMIYTALSRCGWERPSNHPPVGEGWRWYDLLNGLSGVDGAVMLQMIITEMEKDPETYRSLNPENGWGSYDGLLAVLREMRDVAINPHDTHWECSG